MYLLAGAGPDQGDGGEHCAPPEGHRRQERASHAGPDSPGHARPASQRGAVSRPRAVPPHRGGARDRGVDCPAAGAAGRRGQVDERTGAQQAGPGGGHRGQGQHCVHRRGPVHGHEEVHQHSEFLTAKTLEKSIVKLWKEINCKIEKQTNEQQTSSQLYNFLRSKHPSMVKLWR